MNTFPEITYTRRRNGLHVVKLRGEDAKVYVGIGLDYRGALAVAKAKKEAMRPNVLAAALSTFPRARVA
jgi:microsomal dipeptidase-like Zn-dependent dipeptidase